MYPKYLYKNSAEGVIVENEVEEKALVADGYKDSPAAFDIVTHPNPIEEKIKAQAKMAEEKSEKPSKSAKPSQEK